MQSSVWSELSRGFRRMVQRSTRWPVERGVDHGVDVRFNQKGVMMAQVKDPVCGMTIESETAKQTSTYQGKTYYFCSPGCKTSFDRDPEKYLSGSASKSGS